MDTTIALPLLTQRLTELKRRLEEFRASRRVLVSPAGWDEYDRAKAAYLGRKTEGRL